MQLKNGPISLFRLIGYSLSTANKAFGSALFLVFLLFVFFILMTALVFLARFISPTLATILQTLLSLSSSFIGLLFPMALIQILASKAEKTGITAFESITSTILPTLYYIISSLILVVPAVFLIAVALILKSIATTGVVMVILPLLILVYIRFIFLQQTLVLRQHGPIEALRHCWELSRVFYGRIWLNILGALGIAIILILALLCAVKLILPALFNHLDLLRHTPTAMMPMVAAGYLFSLKQSVSVPLLIGSGIIFMAFYYYLLLASNAFITLMFLNLDYSLYATHSRECEGLNDQNILAAQPAPRTPLQPHAQTVVPQQEHRHLGVNKSSFVAESNDENTFRHLNQVYSAQEHLDRAVDQEEDRMPTILFDDDMIKQLAENEKQIAERKNKQQDDDGQETIKMSDKTL